MDDEVAAGTEGAGAELTDVVSFVCGAEEKWGGGLLQLGRAARMLPRCVSGYGTLWFRGQDAFRLCFRG